jgi:hypothetical protein
MGSAPAFRLHPFASLRGYRLYRGYLQRLEVSTSLPKFETLAKVIFTNYIFFWREKKKNRKFFKKYNYHFSTLSYILCIFKRITPNSIAVIINTMLNTPSALKDNLINIVEIMNPEFRITLLNLSECKKENNSNKTSTRIRMVKNHQKIFY